MKPANETDTNRRLIVHLVDVKPDMGGSLPHTCEVVSRLASQLPLVIVTDHQSLLVIRERVSLENVRVVLLPRLLKKGLARFAAEQVILPAMSWSRRKTMVWSPISITAPLLIRTQGYAVSFHDLHTGSTGPGDRLSKRARRSGLKAATIIVPSLAVAERAKQYVPEGRIVVVGGGGTPLETALRPPDIRYAPFAVCVASDEENKGHRTLATAVRRLLVDAPDFRVLLAGARRDPCELDLIYADVPRDAWQDVGFVDRPRLAHLVMSARFLVSPSTYEGLGLAVLDAIATDVPVVATRVGALADHPQLLPSALPPGDSQALASAMLEKWMTGYTYEGGGSDALRAVGLTWAETASHVARALGFPSAAERVRRS